MKTRLIIALILLVGGVQGQGGFRSRIYLPGSPDHQAKAIFETNPGNYIAVGFASDTAGWPQEINRLTIMGLDSKGAIKWHKQYGSYKFFYYNNGFISRSYYKQGNFIYYAGCARDTTNKQIGVLIKFDMNGDTLWQRVYRDPDPQEDVIPQMVSHSIDGGFLITGFFQHWGNHTREGLLIKTDANGHELWRKKISKSAPNVQDGKAIIQDSATKKIVIVGYQYKTQPGNYGNVLVLDSLGNELNRQAFIQGQLTDLAQLPNKSFVTCGLSTWQDAQNNTWYQGYVAQFALNTGPSPVWKYKLLPATKNSGMGCLKIMPDGSILATGWLRERDTIYYMNHDLITFTNMNSSGSVNWEKTYQYKFNAANTHFKVAVRDFELTSDGGWVAALELFNNPHPNPFFFVKYDSTGCDSTSAYCQSVITGENTTLNPSWTNFKLYPNPAVHSVRIFNASALESRYRLSISDVTGKELMSVTEPVSGSEVNVSELPNGLYFVSQIAEGKIRRTQKLLIQK